MTIVGGTETRVNPYGAGCENFFQQATALANGGWVVTWSSSAGYLKNDVYQQAYERRWHTPRRRVTFDAFGACSDGSVQLHRHTHSAEKVARGCVLRSAPSVVRSARCDGQVGSESRLQEPVRSPAKVTVPTSTDPLGESVRRNNLPRNHKPNITGKTTHHVYLRDYYRGSHGPNQYNIP